MIVTKRCTPKTSPKQLPLFLSLTFPLYLSDLKADLATLRAYEAREDIENYRIVLQEVLCLFGQAIHESLTRTMGEYLEVTGGRLGNEHKNEWEKDIASRMLCTNNPAESPFATVRAFLHMYPR